MFNVDPSEFMLLAVVALVVIGPKDLPRAMRFVGQWVGRARGVARQFRSGFDEVIRQAEVEEMEKKWAAENARIMAEHPTVPAEESEDAYYAMAPSPPELPAPGPNPGTDEQKPASAPEPVRDDGRQEPVARS
jgi:sec-independent protein translocase protein TatB